MPVFKLQFCNSLPQSIPTRGWKNAFWFASVIQTCLVGNKMSVTEHFCHPDNLASPCSLVYCWLCSCFPSRSGAPDDGRPRYGLCSFSTLLSVSSCFVAAFTPPLQRMGKCLQSIWLPMKHIFLFTFLFFPCVILFMCRFDFLVCSFDLFLFLVLFILCTVISENKWDVWMDLWLRTSVHLSASAILRVVIVKKNQEPSPIIWRRISSLTSCTKKSPFFTHAWQFGNMQTSLASGF